MMKKILFVIAIFLLFIPSTVYAAEQKLKDTAVRYIKEKENGEYCIDLEEAYKQIGDESKALSGKDGGIENSKKANILATLVTIQNILGGSQGFCIKDEEAAASSMTILKGSGLLGFLNDANLNMMYSFPTVNVVDHLAQTFVPNYKGNNSTMAQESTTVTKDTLDASNCKITEDFCTKACSNYNSVYKSAMYGKLKQWWFKPNQEECNKRCLEAPSCLSSMDPEKPEYTFLGFYNEETPLEEICGGEEMDSRLVGGLTGYAEKALTNIDISSELEVEDDGTLVYNKTTGYKYLQDMKIDKIWAETRNITYILYVTILIVIGFMIMFRNKIGGQMMVSVSNSIPQLIIGLVLVTFSFAIVGFALDIGKMLMVVSNNVLVNLQDSGTSRPIQLGSISYMSDQSIRKITNGAGLNTFDKCNQYYKKTGADGTEQGLRSQVALITTAGLTSALSSTIIDTTISDALSITSWLKFFANLALEVFIHLPATLILIHAVIILLVCVYASFKLFVTMFTTYIKIFMNVILAPFQLLAGSIPGNSSAMTNWFKSVFANVLVFPAIFLVINFAVYLGHNLDSTENFNFFGNSGVMWPSFIANLKGVILVGAYIFCSNLPGVINGFLKVGESKEISVAGEATKKALGKMPLIGGMFG